MILVPDITIQSYLLTYNETCCTDAAKIVCNPKYRISPNALGSKVFYCQKIRKFLTQTCMFWCTLTHCLKPSLCPLWA